MMQMPVAIAILVEHENRLSPRYQTKRNHDATTPTLALQVQGWHRQGLCKYGNLMEHRWKGGTTKSKRGLL